MPGIESLRPASGQERLATGRRPIRPPAPFRAWWAVNPNRPALAFNNHPYHDVFRPDALTFRTWGPRRPTRN